MAPTLDCISDVAETNGFHLVVKNRLAYLWKGYTVNGHITSRTIWYCFDIQKPTTVINWLERNFVG